MASLKTTLLKRRGQVKRVREEFGAVMVVRKGWHYVLCQCKGCKRMFQVPYRAAAFDWACRQLRAHLTSCQGL